MQWVRHLEDGSVNFIEGSISLSFSALFVVKVDVTLLLAFGCNYLPPDFSLLLLRHGH